MNIQFYLDTTRLSKFLNACMTDYIDFICNSKGIYLISNKQDIMSGVYFKVSSQFGFDEDTREMFRFPKDKLSKLALNGICSIELPLTTNTVKVTFMEDECPMYTVELEKEVVKYSTYVHRLNYLGDFDKYPQVDLYKIRDMIGLASQFDSAIMKSGLSKGFFASINIDNGVCFIEYNNTFIYKETELSDLAISGVLAKKLINFGGIIRNVENYLMSVNDGAFLLVNKVNANTFPDYQYIVKNFVNPSVDLDFDISKVALLSKKCSFKGGDCAINFANETCTYKTGTMKFTASVQIKKLNKTPISKEQNRENLLQNLGKNTNTTSFKAGKYAKYGLSTIYIPDWIVSKVLNVNRSLLENLNMQVFNRNVILSTPSFKVLYKRARDVEESLS